MLQLPLKLCHSALFVFPRTLYHLSPKSAKWKPKHSWFIKTCIYAELNKHSTYRFFYSVDVKHVNLIFKKNPPGTVTPRTSIKLVIYSFAPIQSPPHSSASTSALVLASLGLSVSGGHINKNQIKDIMNLRFPRNPSSHSLSSSHSDLCNTVYHSTPTLPQQL